MPDSIEYLSLDEYSADLLGALNRLLRDYTQYGEGITPERIRLILKTSHSHILVATDSDCGDLIVGAALMQRRYTWQGDGEDFLTGIMVRQGWRSKHIEEGLIGKAREISVASPGTNALNVVFRNGCLTTRWLCERLGFVKDEDTAVYRLAHVSP